MTLQNEAKLRSTVAAIIAVLVMFGPDIIEVFDVEASSPGWVRALAKVAGLVIGLATSGKAVALLNVFLPAPKGANVQETTEPTPVAVPLKVVPPPEPKP